MERIVWNDKSIALEKSALTQEDIEYHLDKNQIRLQVERNGSAAERVVKSMEGLNEGAVSCLENNTTIDGSINISELKLHSPFFQEEGICYNEGQEHFTRGYEYISSLDCALTSMQKIRKQRSIAKRALTQLRSGFEKISSIEKLLLLDYLKNSLVTILNAFVYQEKIDGLPVDSSVEYRELREKMKVYSEDVINSSVSILLGDERPSLELLLRDDGDQLLNTVIKKLESYHLGRKLPGAFVGRPEATHPLTIISGAFLCADRYRSIDMVVGVPSGGTEFALTTKIAMNKFGNNGVRSVLIPISLHSAKQFNHSGQSPGQIRSFGESADNSAPREILVCDDNTSTGRTLQALRELLQEKYPEATIYCAVAEADVVRSGHDKENPKRTHIADRNIYADAVNILPVSKTIEPKMDIKEIAERKRIIRYYNNMENTLERKADKIFARVMARINERNGDFSQFNEGNAILEFHNTFLSNFYAAPVEMEGKTYPSVEHAYQAAKFLNFEWSTLPANVKEEIAEAIKTKGVPADMPIDGNIFASTRLTSGITKTVANILRENGFEDEGWEERRVRVMIDLLIQKFSDKNLLQKLLETKGKELIEGNTWGDTLWGVSDGKGRNLLGEILMDIRDSEDKSPTGPEV